MRDRPFCARREVSIAALPPACPLRFSPASWMLEKEMPTGGRTATILVVARNTERNAEANTSYGKMLPVVIEPFWHGPSASSWKQPDRAAWTRHKVLLEGMDVQVVAFIALRKVLDTFSQSICPFSVCRSLSGGSGNGEEADGITGAGSRPLPDDAAVHRRQQAPRYVRLYALC